eukprot:scaffold2536_cov169-Amphora_coffeaeformis.AAC.13
MGAPNKQPTSPQRRVTVRQAAFRQTGNAVKTVFLGDHSNTEKCLLKRVEDLEHKLAQGTAKLVVAEADSKGEHVDVPCAAADKDKGDRNKVVKNDPQTNNEIFSDRDLEGMPALLPQPPLVTKNPTRVRRLVIVKKKKSPPLTPSLRGNNSGRKVTRKIIKKKKKRVHAGTLDQVLDSLQRESLLKKDSSSAPTTSEEEDFVMTLRRAEYWKGQHLRADARVKHLERQKEQLERRLEHLESGVLKRLEHIVSTAGS